MLLASENASVGTRLCAVVCRAGPPGGAATRRPKARPVATRPGSKSLDQRQIQTSTAVIASSTSA